MVNYSLAYGKLSILKFDTSDAAWIIIIDTQRLISSHYCVLYAINKIIWLTTTINRLYVHLV